MNNNLPDNSKYDVCIVGAGVAGATMAARLGKAGKKVVVVERNLKERDVIVGELLQPGGVESLQKMGLEFFLHNMDAQPVRGYNILYKGRDVVVKYPHENGEPLGYGFRNGKFVQNMKHFIQSLENVDVIEGRVVSLIEEDGEIMGVNYNLNGVEETQSGLAPLTIVSDGPLSKLRGLLSNPEIKVNGYFVGIILENCPLPHPGYGHLVMGDHSPFVMYPVNSNEIRILIDFPGSEPPKINEDFKDKMLEDFLPNMPESMKKSFNIAVAKGGFKMMPNHRLPASPELKRGAVLVGDSLNMRHPLTGGGMTAAFSDVHKLSDLLLQLDDFNDKQKVDKAVREFYETRHLGNQTINILADGLYGVVKHPDLQEAFFEYVNRGGKFANEPIAILSGLNKNKKLLQKHFLAVANYGTKMKIRNEVGAAKIGSSYSLIKEAVHIIAPLLLSEKPDTATRLLLKTLAK